MSKKAALLVVIAAIVAFATTAGGGAAKPNAQFTIGFIPPVLANPAIKALNDGIAAKAKALGMTFETIGGQYSPQAQIVAMNAAIQKKVNMILIWPLDHSQFAEILEGILRQLELYPKPEQWLDLVVAF